jgi:uncharacterized protein (DUF433 family)
MTKVTERGSGIPLPTLFRFLQPSSVASTTASEIDSRRLARRRPNIGAGRRNLLRAESFGVALRKEFLAMAVLDWSQCDAVESVPGKVSGAWVLRGTRMPVSAIFENLAAGASIDDLMEWFQGLQREQVKAVIEFAGRSLSKDSTVAA